jgi:hypothetical protein
MEQRVARLARRTFVAQTAGLLYRRLPVGRALQCGARADFLRFAGWQPAIRQTGGLRYVAGLRYDPALRSLIDSKRSAITSPFSFAPMFPLP